MADKFDNPNMVVFQENIALVEKKEREMRNTGGALSASWNNPIEDLDPSLITDDKRRAIIESQQRDAERRAREQVAPRAAGRSAHLPPPPVEGTIVIPLPAMKKFKALLGKLFELKVILAPDQAAMFLADLQTMKTPKNMSDTKYIVKLIESLEGIVKTNEPNPSA